MIQTLKKEGDLEIKYIPEGHPVNTFAIFDNKEAIIAMSQKIMPSSSCNLWTNNPCVTQLIQDSFERIWETALEDKHE